MAELLTWEEKVKKGLPLSPLEEVKRDATRITLKRIRDNQEEAQYQETKDEVPQESEEDEEETSDDGEYQEKTDKNGKTFYVGPTGKRVSKEEYASGKEPK